MARENLLRWVLGFLLLFCLAANIPRGPENFDRKSFESKLREAMVGKVATLRNFYIESDLNFDSHGKLINKSKTGPWTYYGRVQVASIKLSNDLLTIKGERNVVQWEAAGREFENRTLEKTIRIAIQLPAELDEKSLLNAIDSIFLTRDTPLSDIVPDYWKDLLTTERQRRMEFENRTLEKTVRIAIQLPAGHDEKSVLNAIDSVFLTRDTPLSDIVPDYWKDLLTTERQRRMEFEKQKAAIMKSVREVDAGINPPKLRSSAAGIETSLTPFKDVRATELTFSLVVDENGEVKELQIEKPLGLGIDDPVADTIAHWKWAPATQAGQPVSVKMYARLRVLTKDGKIDPYHTQPCPFVENVFAC